MTVNPRQAALKRGGTLTMGLASAMCCAALLLMPVVFPLDGKPHGDWPQFLGRFHPALVHLPIGLILLVPVLEFLGRARPALREAASVVLWLSFPACVGSTILGYLLAFGSGDAGVRVARHMWGGIALTAAVLVCALLRTQWGNGVAGKAYLPVLVGVLVLTVWSTHEGGSLTHGDNYLTEHAPSMWKWPSMFSAPETESATPESFYSMRLRPVFDAKCESCHGSSKVKGKLRMDSYDRLMRGGKDGAVVIPGSAERSLLFQRITLPPNDKKYMPSDGKPPLTPSEVAMIRAWIADGASPTAVSVKGIP